MTSALILLKQSQVCNDLRDLSVHLNEASISYFNPFRPMLGQRAAIDQVGCQVEGLADSIMTRRGNDLKWYAHIYVADHETNGTSAVLH